MGEDEIKNLKNENNTTQRKHLEIKNDFEEKLKSLELGKIKIRNLENSNRALKKEKIEVDEKLRSEVSTCAGLKVGRAILMRQIHCHQKSEQQLKKEIESLENKNKISGT